MIDLTVRRARRFMLLKQGLLGGYKFSGKDGAVEFIRQAGCVQYDPIDICGRNADLTLQSRVRGYTREMLDELLYKDRLLIDYPDKNTSITLTEDWPYFERDRRAARRRAEGYPELVELMQRVLAFIRDNGAACPDELKLDSDFRWRAHIVWSSGKNLSASVMEQLYGAGELIIHHKNGARKYYDLAARHIPARLLNAGDPFRDDFERAKWIVWRRVGAVGLFWDHSSDAIWRIGTDERNKIFSALSDEGKLVGVSVGGLNEKFYIRSEDINLIDHALNDPEPAPRCELLAPLDCFLWDRKLIKTIFGFDYKWEIYTPAVKRKYGHYVLPLLCGERFIGRVEAVRERDTKTLAIKNIWYEDGVRRAKKTDAAIDKCLRRFAAFNGCGSVSRAERAPDTV